MENKELNPNQIEAINHLDGPMMVLAGPGSGKTWVITERVRHLINEIGINSRNILVITFTKAAALEMKDRYIKLVNSSNLPLFSTFHSFFFRILKMAYPSLNGDNIIKEWQQQKLLKSIIEKNKIESDNIKELVANTIKDISSYKSCENNNSFMPNSMEKESFHSVIKEYSSVLRANKLMDFDDIVLYCFDLLNSRRDILQRIRDIYQYILIDEFQDISPIQYKMMQIIAFPKNNLFIVGDDDQSIYRFRGASPMIMLNFPKDYKSAKITILNRNYRSNNSIVTVAGRLISHNKNRFKKELVANAKENNSIQIINAGDSFIQNKHIIKTIEEMVAKGSYSYEDFAILFRTNNEAHPLIALLTAYNIPYSCKDIVYDIFKHFVAIHILSYLKIAMSYGKDKSFSRSDFVVIMNKPLRYFSRELVGKEDKITFSYLHNVGMDKAYLQKNISVMKHDIENLCGLNPQNAISYIRRIVGYESYLKEYCKGAGLDIEAYIDIMDEIEEMAGQYNTIEDFFKGIEEYREILQEKQRENNENKEQRGVQLSTFHSSKGLEYRVVFIINVNEKVTPYKKAISDLDIEEERRLFYVAMTRAKESLIIIIPESKNKKERKPSRFISELSTII